MEEIRLQVEGISCAGCATDMETVLKNIGGILNVKVDYAIERMIIEYSPDEIEKEQIISIAKRMGFEVKVI